MKRSGYIANKIYVIVKSRGFFSRERNNDVAARQGAQRFSAFLLPRGNKIKHLYVVRHIVDNQCVTAPMGAVRTFSTYLT